MAYVIFFIKELAAVPADIDLTGSLTVWTVLINLYLPLAVTCFTGNVLFSSKVKLSFCIAVYSFKMTAYIKSIIFKACSSTGITFLIVHYN